MTLKSSIHKSKFQASKKTAYPEMKLWLKSKDNDNFFGDGKFLLLQNIQQTGSLSAAAEELGMSYRKAWGDIAKAEARIGEKLVVRQRGGKSGGETHLTEIGIKLIKAYIDFRKDMQKHLESSYKKHMAPYIPMHQDRRKNEKQ